MTGGSYRTDCVGCDEEIGASSRFCPNCGDRQPWFSDDPEIRTDGGAGSESCDGCGAEDAAPVKAPTALRFCDGCITVDDDWYLKAYENVEKWGVQDVEPLLLAMQEEQGELAQAFLEATHEGGDPERIREELDDLAALCIQLAWRLAADERGEST